LEALAASRINVSRKIPAIANFSERLMNPRVTIALLVRRRLTAEATVKEIVSTITSKGQVTIPAEVRRHLGVHEGDKLSFVIPDAGAVELRVPKYPTVASLRGQAAKLSEDLTFHEMKQIAYADRLAAKHNKKA
jgi:AbrB family looped-hinge helix DNA binding protein